MNIYTQGGGYYDGGGYKWVHVKLHDFKTDRETYKPSVLSKCSFTTLEPVRAGHHHGKEAALYTQPIEAYSEGWNMHTIQEWARFLNRKYAVKLAGENTKRAQWIKWQAERVATWAPAPLTLRK